MYIYIFIYLLTFFSLIVSQKYKEYKSALSLIILFLLILIAGFRYNVGQDYDAYKTIFNHVVNHPDEQLRSEWGFFQLCKFIIWIHGTYQLMFLICTIFTLSCIYYYYKTVSPNILYSLFIFLCIGQLYLNTFNVIRQYLAIGCLLLAIPFLVRKKLIKYCILIFIGTLFHATIIIFLPLFFLINKNISIKLWSIFTILAVSSGNIIINLILHSSYAPYLTFETYSANFTITNYIMSGISIIILFTGKRYGLKKQETHYLYNLNSIFLILSVLIFVFDDTPMVMVLNRLTYYFIIFYPISFLIIISNMKKKNMIELCLIIALSLIYFRASILLGDKYHLIPYEANFNLFNI